MSTANAARGEAALTIGGATLVLRPSFAALVCAEEELGSLFALIERATAGQLKLGEIAALFWHCLHDAPAGLTRATFSEGLAEAGLAAATPVLGRVIGQILQGR